MILQIHTADGDSMFIDMGKEYTIVKRDFPNFDGLLQKATNGDTKTYDDVFAFVSYHGGTSNLPLWKGTPYYVYSEGGRLFDTLTFR